MTADRQFLRVTWQFHIEGTDEIAVTNLNFSNPGVPGFDAVTVLDDLDWPTDGAAMATRMTTLLGSANMRWADYSELVGVRVAAVSTAGLELAAPKLFVLSPTVDGSHGDVIAQSSIVLSLRSNTFGPGGNFGRMFLPHTSWALGTNSPRADSADVSAFATACETFVEGCNTSMNVSTATEVEAKIMSLITGRESRRVNQIALGDVTDTQRRRRNALPEIYTFRTIT